MATKKTAKAIDSNLRSLSHLPPDLSVEVIKGEVYVNIKSLEGYSVSEKRRQLNCTPPAALYNQIESYCNNVLGSLTKSEFMVIAAREYLVALDASDDGIEVNDQDVDVVTDIDDDDL